MDETDESLETYIENINEDSDSDTELEADQKRRLVVFGQLDLTVKAGLAHHWSVKLVDCSHDPPCDEEGADTDVAAECAASEGVWFEVDGFQLDDMRNLKHNSINNSDDYGEPGEWRGVNSRLNSLPEKIVGATLRKDLEIYLFNREYLAAHPKYSLLRDNCQNYAEQFTDFLVKEEGVFLKHGIERENVKDVMHDIADRAGDFAEDHDLQDVADTARSGFAKLRAFKRDYKAKLKAKLHLS